MGVERLLQAFRRKGRRRGGDHPTPEILAAYQANELTADENAAIQEHFLHCRECPETLLDLREFSHPRENDTAELSDTWLTLAWQRLRARIARESDRVGPCRWVATPRRALVACSCLLAVLLGLASWVAWLHTEMRRLSRPQINFPVATIELGAPGTEPLGVVIPASAERFLLVVVAPPDLVGRQESRARPPAALRRTGSRGYGLELVTHRGQAVWNGDGLTLDASGSLTLDVPRRLLPAGAYRLRILNLEGGRREEVAARELILSYRRASAATRGQHPAAKGVS